MFGGYHRSLDLRHNRIQNAIPFGLSALLQLKALQFSFNELSGDIPDSLSAMGNLTSIDFDNNAFTGVLSSNLTRLTALRSLSICNNRLTSPIPSFIATMTNLTTVRLTLQQCDTHCTCQHGYYCYVNASTDLSPLQCSGNDNCTSEGYACHGCEEGYFCLDGLRVRASRWHRGVFNSERGNH